MLQKKLLGALFGTTEPKFRFSFDELKNLYDVINRNPVVNEQNKALVVETIRSISEFIIWGDQNEVKVFEFFLENNIMVYLHKILQQRSNRTGDVAKQVLQTLSIIIQNVKSETGIFFLFSNNHINNIIEVEFDFEDEEVMGYYVSFLKTISLKLNQRTVQFFFDNKNGKITFPLYMYATRFAHHKEGMVRAAVRTLTLSIYCVEDPFVQTFIINPPATNFFQDITRYLAEQIKMLDKRLGAAELGGSQAMSALDSQLAEVEDIISYCSDVLSIGSQELAHLLAQELWGSVIVPLLLMPLLDLGSTVMQQAAEGSSRSRAKCALYILERFVVICCYKPLLHQLLLALLGAQLPQQQRSRGAPQPAAGSSSSSTAAIPEIPRPTGKDSSSGSAPIQHHSALQHRAIASPYKKQLRYFLLDTLRGDHAALAYHVLRLMAAIQQCKSAAPELLCLLGIASKAKAADVEAQRLEGSCALCKLQQQLQLFTVASSSSAFMAAVQDPVCRDALLWVHGYLGLPGGERRTPAGPDRAASPHPAAAAAAAAASDGTPAGSDEASAADTDSQVGGGRSNVSSTTPTPARSIPNSPSKQQQEQQQQQQEEEEAPEQDGVLDEQQLIQELQLEDAEQPSSPKPPAVCLAQHSHSYAGSSSCDPALLEALFQLLSLQMFPAAGMWLLAWHLHQLLPAAAPPAAPAAAPAAAPSSPAKPPHEHPTPDAADSIAPAAEAAAAAASPKPPHPPPTPDHAADHTHDAPQDVPHSMPATIVPTAQLSASLPSSTALPSTATTAATLPTPPQPPTPTLTPQQHQQLQTALSSAQTALLEELSSMWCEAVFPIMSNEWPAAREAMLRPALRSSSDALLSGPALYPLCRPRPVNGSSARELSLSASALAALRTLYRVQRAVALLQLKELLFTSTIPRAAPMPAVSEADLKRADTQEGCQVDLIPGSAIPCVVSFAPGQERRVYFAVAGLALRRLTQEPGQDRTQAHSALLHSLPVAVLADPAPAKLNAGVVLSVAPLLGADPGVDKGVAKWLHVHVRPSVRGLLRVLKTAVAKKGLMSAMRQLSDGHWVLSFPDAERCSNARMLVHQHAAKLRALYCEVLEPVMAVSMAGEQQQQQQQGEQGEQERVQQQGGVASAGLYRLL